MEKEFIKKLKEKINDCQNHVHTNGRCNYIRINKLMEIIDDLNLKKGIFVSYKWEM